MSAARSVRDLVTGRGLRRGTRALQTGALPWRMQDGALEILLVTSRNSDRWIVPKGWPMSGKTLAEAAAQEAYEEAGVAGTVSVKEIGSFDYAKSHPLLGELRCRIVLFPLAVAEEFPDWPERGQRTREWLGRSEAAARVFSPELSALIQGFSPA